jgi:diguanylate cyclase (GGDEF)-like protein
VDPVIATAAISAAFGTVGAWQMYRRAQRAERRIDALRGELLTERHAASHDPLTDLLNRRAFYQQGLAVIADRARHPLVTLVLDIDRFKQVNDCFGHAAGDEVLATVGRRFATYADGNLVARLGGDEFAGLLSLPTADSQRLHQIVFELGELVARPIGLGDHVVSITASIGMATVRGPDIAAFAEALREADHNMYRNRATTRAAVHHRSAEPVQHTAARSAPPNRGSLTHHAVRPATAAERQPDYPSRRPPRAPQAPDLQRR